MRLPGSARRTERGPDDDPAPAPPRPESPSWGFEPGDELVAGRTVLKKIGGGHFHEALLVWDDQRYAVMVAKALRPGLHEDARALRALYREAQALDHLSHPVILRAFDAVLEGERPHLLLEHLEGATVRSVMERGGGVLPLEQLLPLLLHVASALHYLEQVGWVHLDIKPENTIMGVPPRVIDLSLARTLEDARHLNASTGTDAYMPPEQCVPERFPGVVGPPSDVFGLGATIYHALSGSRPFPRPPGARHSEVAEERFPQLVQAPEPLPASSPAPLAELLGDMLAHHAERRPTAAEVVQRLEPMVDALPRRMILTRSGVRGRR